MYAIVDITGHQYKVEKDMVLNVNQVTGDKGETMEFNTVLLVDEDGVVQVGKPTVTGAVVTARILEHLKGDKVLVFKKKRKKGYQKLNGHRQCLSKIQIEEIKTK